MSHYRLSKRMKSKLSRGGLLWAFSGLLVFTASVLATSSLAWFTVGNTTYVRNLQIAYEANDFTVEIKDTNGDFISSETGVFVFSDPVSTSAVSSMYTDDWYDVNTVDPEVDFPGLRTTYGSQRSNTRTPIASPGVNYLAFELYFSCKQDAYVYLDETTSVKPNHDINVATSNSSPAYSLIPSMTPEALDKITDSIRISFFSNMGYTIFEPNVESSSETRFAGKLDIAPSDGFYDFDEDGKEFLYGEYDPSCLEQLDYQEVTVENSFEPQGNAFEGVSKKGNLAYSEEKVQELDSKGLIAHEKTYTLKELDLDADDKHPLLFIPAGSTRRMVMSIYAEGWDKDCTNAVEFASFATNVVFSGRYAPKGHDGPIVIDY